MKTLSIEQMLQVSGGENKVTYEFVIYASYFDQFQKYLDQYQQNKITAQQLVSLSYSYSAPKTTSGYSTILISV